MKKFGKLFSILLVVVLLTTGCVKYEIGMEVGSDKSFTFEMITGISSSLMEDGDSTDSSILDDDTKQAYEDAGFTAEDYQDDDYVGIKLTKKYDSIDLVSSSNCGTIELTTLFGENDDEESVDASNLVFFKKSSSFISDTYTATFTVDLTEEDGEDYSSYSSMFDFNYHITLPVKASSNDATSVSEDGLTYTWDLEYGKLNEINYSFTMYKVNPTLIIGIVIAVIVIIIIIIVVSRKGKKNPDQSQVVADGNASPVNGGMPAPNMDTNNINNPVAMNNNFAANDMPGMMQPNSPQQFNDPNVGNVNDSQPVNVQPDIPSFTSGIPETENIVSLEQQPPIIPTNNQPVVDSTPVSDTNVVSEQPMDNVNNNQVPVNNIDSNTPDMTNNIPEPIQPEVKPQPEVQTPNSDIPPIDPNQLNQ